jgi:hypothetical protein
MVKKKVIPGVKFDKEKIRWDLLELGPIEGVIRVLMYGANKYPEDDNWKRVPESKRRYYSACLRHITAWWRGERLDSETGESHLAHAIACLVFLMWHDEQRTYDNNKKKNKR